MTRLIVDISPEKMNAAINALLQKGIIHNQKKVEFASDMGGYTHYTILQSLQQTNTKHSSGTLFYCFSDWDIFCNELEFE